MSWSKKSRESEGGCVAKSKEGLGHAGASLDLGKKKEKQGVGGWRQGEESC